MSFYSSSMNFSSFLIVLFYFSTLRKQPTMYASGNRKNWKQELETMVSGSSLSLAVWPRAPRLSSQVSVVRRLYHLISPSLPALHGILIELCFTVHYPGPSLFFLDLHLASKVLISIWTKEERKIKRFVLYLVLDKKMQNEWGKLTWPKLLTDHKGFGF